MLKEFSVSNFKSIGKEQFFTMEACPRSEIGEFDDTHVVDLNGERLLKIASIYGPNGSGKSNLVDAINVMKAIIFNQHIPLNNNDDNPFYKFAGSDEKNTIFELFFIESGYEIGYKLEVDLNNTKNLLLGPVISVALDYKIISEECSYRKIGNEEFKTLYYRSEDSSLDSESIKNLDVFSSKYLKLNKETTLINYIRTTFKRDVLLSDKFLKILVYVIDFFSGIYYVQKNDVNFRFTELDVRHYGENLSKVTEYLNNMDLNIQSIEFIKNKYDDFFSLYLVRKYNNKEIKMPLSSDSAGTRKLVYDLLHFLDHRFSLYLIDDFDSLLHPKLLELLISLFNDKNQNKKQFIFNSHDILNMNNKLFRRDEIWFAYKDCDLQSNYFSLSSIRNYKGEQVRKDAKYGKQYLDGRYGADPFIEKGLKWEIED